MELRRRRRYRSKRIAGSYSSCVFAVASVFLILTLFIAFSEPGTWIAESVFKPIFARDDAEDSADAADASVNENLGEAVFGEADEVVTKQVTIPPFTCHALQMGVFDEEANARSKALELSVQGAGGYVYAGDGDGYRVLAAGYTSAESLNKVRENLKTEFIDSMPFEIRTEECALSISAAEESVQAAEDAATYLVTLADELLELSIAFDRDGLRVSSGVERIRMIREETAARAEALSKLTGEDNPVLEPVVDCLQHAIAKMDELSGKEEGTKAAFSSGLKYLSLMYVSDLEEAVNALREGGR